MIQVITYAESRNDFFEKQLSKSQRALNKVVKYSTDPDACAEQGEIVSFYQDAITALREQAEREKGCEFCCYTEYPEKQLYPKRDYLFYAGYSKQIKVDEFDEFETEEINYCPMCGKKLKEV